MRAPEDLLICCKGERGAASPPSTPFILPPPSLSGCPGQKVTGHLRRWKCVCVRACVFIHAANVTKTLIRLQQLLKPLPWSDCRWVEAVIQDESAATLIWFTREWIIISKECLLETNVRNFRDLSVFGHVCGAFNAFKKRILSNSWF